MIYAFNLDNYPTFICMFTIHEKRFSFTYGFGKILVEFNFAN